MTLVNCRRERRSENKTNMSGTIRQHSYGDIDPHASITRGFHMAREMFSFEKQMIDQWLFYESNRHWPDWFVADLNMNLKPLPYGIDTTLSGEIWSLCGGVIRQSISLCKATHYMVHYKQGNKAGGNRCVCQFLCFIYCPAITYWTTLKNKNKTRPL